MGYKIRGSMLYVHGTVHGKFYRLSSGKKATPSNIDWIKKNHRDVLLQLIDEEKPKRSEMFSEYAMQSIEANAYAIKGSTHAGYLSMAKKHIIPYFKSFRLDEIRPSDIKLWQTKLLNTLNARSVKNVRILLGKILNDARMDELIDKNPVSLVKPPKYVRTEGVHPFTMEEVHTLIDKADSWMRRFLTVAFFTGMRSGELIALKWEDIDFNSKRIIVRRSIRRGVEGSTKTGRERIIDLLSPVEEVLKELFLINGLKNSYIFTSRKGTPYTEPRSITETKWKPLLRKCSMAYRVLYTTRHTFASLMLLNGEDILWVSKMLGHSDVSTTMKYYIKFVEEKSQRRASFLDAFSHKNCTVIAHNSNQSAANA